MCTICGGGYVVHTPVEHGYFFEPCPQCGEQPQEEHDKEFAELYKRLDEAEARSKEKHSA
ncbi:hypothetical protein [Pontibacillus salipaludis]|uniref:Uncharacterized protein n=1 Tax=Pontibacillus salipaludis TaxID=1697394 RepID=A0ABQ1PVK2_9BACI|nr:hypothetical protein [Pontibacillus salipaludis]GGD05180.1 hypothetical protein GCM10011389_10850 [Pontibacillus salipaludis]